MARLSNFLLTLILTVTFTLLPSCKKDDPEGEHGNHRPGIAVVDDDEEHDPTDPANGNPGNTPGSQNPDEPDDPNNQGQQNDDPEDVEDSNLVGEWLEAAKQNDRFIFERNKTFRRLKLNSQSGEWSLYQEGSFSYNDVTRWLWLSISEPDIAYLEEYKCILADNELTLVEPMTGKTKKYTRVSNS